MDSSKPAPSDPPPPPPYYYHPLPPEDSHNYHIILLPRHPPTHRRRRRKDLCLFICTTIFLLLSAATLYILFPSDPDISIVRLHLDRVKIRTNPLPSLDISLNLLIKVRNRDFYSIDYDDLLVAIGYRGNRLGFVTADHGHVKARRTSYIEATLVLDGAEVLSDVFLLLEDLARGVIPFDTVTQVQGRIGLFFFDIPLKAKVSCEVYVDTSNQAIVRQNCYPE